MTPPSWNGRQSVSAMVDGAVIFGTVKPNTAIAEKPGTWSDHEANWVEDLEWNHDDYWTEVPERKIEPQHTD